MNDANKALKEFIDFLLENPDADETDKHCKLVDILEKYDLDISEDF